MAQNYKINGFPGFAFPGETGVPGVRGLNMFFGEICYNRIEPILGGLSSSEDIYTATISEKDKDGNVKLDDKTKKPITHTYGVLYFDSDPDRTENYVLVKQTDKVVGKIKSKVERVPFSISYGNIKAGDLIIISGRGETAIYKIDYADIYGTEELRIIDTPIYSFKTAQKPSYHYDVTLSALVSEQIKIYQIFSADDADRAKIVAVMFDENGEAVEFGANNVIGGTGCTEFVLKDYNKSESDWSSINCPWMYKKFAKIQIFMYYKVTEYKAQKIFLTQLDLPTDEKSN